MNSKVVSNFLIFFFLYITILLLLYYYFIYIYLLPTTLLYILLYFNKLQVGSNLIFCINQLTTYYTIYILKNLILKCNRIQ